MGQRPIDYAKYRVSKRDLWDDWQKRIRRGYAVFDLEPARTCKRRSRATVCGHERINLLVYAIVSGSI